MRAFGWFPLSIGSVNLNFDKWMGIGNMIRDNSSIIVTNFSSEPKICKAFQ